MEITCGFKDVNPTHCINFSTGAYIFGNAGFGEESDYPTELFMQFFDELKSYKPDFIDSANHGLYFKLRNTKAIYNDFSNILHKYHELNVEDKKRREIEKLEAKLKAMKS